MKKVTINGESKTPVLPEFMIQARKAATAAKRESDNVELTGSTGDKPISKQEGGALSPTLPLPVKLAKMYSICSPKVALEAGIVLMDRLGNKMNEEKVDDYVLYIPTDDTVDDFYSDEDAEFLKDYSEQVIDFPTYCATVFASMSKRVTPTMKFFLTAFITGDEAMMAVLKFKEETGLSLETAKKYLLFKAPQTNKANKDGKVRKTPVRGWEKKMVTMPDEVSKPHVETRRATPEVREYVASLIKDKTFSPRQLSREAVIRNVMKDYFESLGTEEKGGETDDGRPDATDTGEGNNPPETTHPEAA